MIQQSVMKIIGALAAGAVATLFLMNGGVHATSYGGGNVQEYSAEQPLDAGTIVRLADGDAKTVQIASKAKLAHMFGVVVDPQQVSIRISNDGVQNSTYVATTGTYTVLVSTQNGPIQAGDYVTLSAVDGVAMKAGTEEASVFGRAASGFDGQGAVRGSVALQDSSGNTAKTVQLGSIPVSVEIKPNPNEKSTKAKVPEVLERVGQAIAENEVSAIRIYISLAITAISLITALAVLYVGVRGSVIAIGRNPLSKKSILRALLEIILTSALILIIGLFAVYLLLRL